MAGNDDLRLADGWLELPQHVWVEEAALGGSFPATISDSDLTLVLPVAGEGESTGLRPPPPVPGVTSAKARKASVTWGFASRDGTGRADTLRLAIEVPLEGEPTTHVVEPNEVRAWLEVFLEWTTAWTNDPWLRDSVLHGHLRVVDVDGVRSYGHGGTSVVGTPIRARPSSALTLDQVTGAAAKASSGERIPLEHRLLIGAFMSDDPRGALIDAATAVEVALSTNVTDRLSARGVPDDVAKELLSRTNGLESLGKLHRKLVGDFRPKDVGGSAFEELCQQRNAAVHRGAKPDRADALHTSVRIVDHVRPLPS
jgi:hypothetical protein